MSITTTPLKWGNALYIRNGGVLVEYKGGMYVCTRADGDKAGSVEFSPHGGYLYAHGVHVGSIYLDDTDTAEYPSCYWSKHYMRRCECGHGQVSDSIMYKFESPFETVVNATLHYVC